MLNVRCLGSLNYVLRRFNRSFEPKIVFETIHENDNFALKIEISAVRIFLYKMSQL